MINVNQLTSQLAKMPDPMLQKYAAMHKNDPYTVALALSESNRRKAMRVGASPLPGEQPKVVDQDIAEMAAPTQQMPQQMAQQQLPENTGIGRLPAPNMQGMADGGIVGFAAGDKVNDVEAYRKYALEKAQTMGLDPMWVDRVLSHESKYNPEAVSPTGPTGIGQLAKATAKHYMKQVGHLAKGEKFDPEIRKDPYKNIDASLAFMVDLKTKYNNDPQKMAVGYNQGETYLNKHLAENNGELNIAKLKDEPRNYLSKTGNMLVPGAGTAQAGAPAVSAAPAQPSALSQIPTGGVPGAGPTAPGPDTRSYFGKIADKMGIPEEAQRNINNTLSALGGYTAPAAGVSKGVGIASKGLAATPEMIAKAEQLKNATALTRIAPPVAKGIETLAPEAQALRAAAEEARRVRQMAGDVNAAKGAEQSVKAADLTAKLARETEQGLAVQQQTQMLNAAKAANVGRATTGMQAIDAIQPEPRVTGLPMDDLGFDKSGLDALSQPTTKGGVEDLINNTAKDAGMKPSKFKDEMALQFFLGLMGGQSPNAMSNVSTAGLGALKFGQELKKDESEQMYREALAKHYGVDPMIQRATALQDPAIAKQFAKMKELEREPVTKEALLKAFMNSPEGMAASSDPTKFRTAFQNYIQSYESVLGPIGGMPPGVRVTRSGS